MSKSDPHTKKQKQIRMSDELRARFDKAQKASKLPADEFISSCLDALERKNDITQAEVLRWIKEHSK